MSTQRTPRVVRVPLNEHGRDFVLGDIHGAYDLVIEAMKNVQFDCKVDRIFSVGDLIDRGPQSARVIKFLQQLYVFAIRGNHEANMLSLYSGGHVEEKVLSQAARFLRIEWWLKETVETRNSILALIARLPVAMEIETCRGPVGLVHGDIPKGMTWQKFLSKVEAGDPKVLEVALEGRDRIRGNDTSGVEGISRIFVGHTTLKGGPQRFGNVFAIDTGAIFKELLVEKRDDYGLTFANLTFNTGSLNTIPRAPLPRVSVLDGSEDDAPFGDYMQMS